MKKIFLDTNFVIDYFVRDSYRSDSELLLNQGKDLGMIFYISFLSIANFAYIVRKQPQPVILEMIKDCCKLFNIIPNTDSQIMSAIELKAADFEDALQYQAALDAGCECIITRNEKDFGFSQIPVSSASDFVDRYFRG
ncbi:MAG: PIN domain-containing protein [Muribaculaceae bacterium]|nr:PIN domain-containing protein [Muribaculaceae bacterium]